MLFHLSRPGNQVLPRKKKTFCFPSRSSSGHISTSYQYHEVWQSVIGLRSNASVYYRSKRRFIGRARGRPCQTPGRGITSLSLLFRVYFETGIIIIPGWRCAGKSPPSWKLLSSVIFTCCSATLKRFSALPNSDELTTFPVLRSPFKATVDIIFYFLWLEEVWLLLYVVTFLFSSRHKAGKKDSLGST